MRLDNWADQNNARGEYEQLRAEILSIYFDLVTPNVVAELANIPEDDTAKPLSQDEVQHAETRLQKMRRLVLSRTYVIRTLGIDEIEQLLLEEIEEDRAKTKRNLTTQVQVSGFIRRLPHNFSASAKQRALCLEHMGIVLADHGETYVHDYAYGPDKDPPPKGHKAYFARHSRTRKRQK